MKNENLQILISGCPRSGTRFISHQLQSNGIKAPHEKIGRNGSVSWFHILPNYHFPKWAIKNSEQFNPKFILHQIRPPFETINSMLAIADDSFNVMAGYLNLPSDRSLENHMKVWLEWNKMVEKRSEFTYSLYDLTKLKSFIKTKFGRKFKIVDATNSQKNVRQKMSNVKTTTKQCYNFAHSLAVECDQYYNDLI